MEPIKPAVPEVKPVVPAATTPPGGTTPVTPTPAATTPTPTPAATPGAPTPAATPATPATPGASPTPGAKPTEGTQVPITALHEERTKRQALEAEIAQLKVQSQPQAQVQQPSAQQHADGAVIRKEIDELWDSDPKKAVQAEIMVALDWRDRVDANMDLDADVLAQKYADFNQYRSAAQGYVRSLPLDQRSKQGIMELAYMVVRGQNVDTLMETQRNDMIQKYQSGELAASMASAPAGTVTPAPVVGTQLTEDQSKAAAMMNLTPEQYASAIVSGK